MRKLTVLLIVCAVVLLAFSATANAKPVTRPFLAHVSGGVGYQLIDGVLYTTSSAAGWATHLGWTTMTARHPTPIGQADYGPGEMVLTGATGAQVKITYTGHMEFDPTAPAGTWFVGPGAGTITGGTGRFTNASGSVQMTVHILYPGTLDPAYEPWTAWWSMAGTIKY